MHKGCWTILPILGTVLFGIMTLAMLIVALMVEQVMIAVTFAVLFGAVTVFCAYSLGRQLRQRSEQGGLSDLGQERTRVLRLARSRKGRLTAEEAALGCHISVVQAQALLDEMVMGGIADTWVSDGGVLVYVFRGLLEADEKDTAQDPMKMLEP